MHLLRKLQAETKRVRHQTLRLAQRRRRDTVGHVEAARFERTLRTESSEIFIVYGGARRIGRVDIHYGRFEVHATLLLDTELTDDELQQLIDQLDEELVQTHDPEREDFLVTVYKAEELGFYSDEFESDDDDDDDEDEEDR